MMKDIKKKIVTTSLGAMALVSGLTGCNSNTKQVSSEEKSNITTEVPTTEEATLSAEEAQLESNREQYKEVALNSYETYQEFYDDITEDYLFDKIHKLKLPIKTILLNQNIICGIGNIYDDEILFKSGISPMRRGCDISRNECLTIINNTKIILSEAVKLGGTTIKSFTSSEGVHGLFQAKLNVHGKKNALCPTCNSQIIVTHINGRGTYYCPKCQK